MYKFKSQRHCASVCNKRNQISQLHIRDLDSTLERLMVRDRSRSGRECDNGAGGRTGAQRGVASDDGGRSQRGGNSAEGEAGCSIAGDRDSIAT